MPRLAVPSIPTRSRSPRITKNHSQLAARIMVSGIPAISSITRRLLLGLSCPFNPGSVSFPSGTATGCCCAAQKACQCSRHAKPLHRIATMLLRADVDDLPVHLQRTGLPAVQPHQVGNMVLPLLPALSPDAVCPSPGPEALSAMAPQRTAPPASTALPVQCTDVP